MLCTYSFKLLNNLILQLNIYLFLSQLRTFLKHINHVFLANFRKKKKKEKKLPLASRYKIQPIDVFFIFRCGLPSCNTQQWSWTRLCALNKNLSCITVQPLKGHLNPPVFCFVKMTIIKGNDHYSVTYSQG